MTNIKFPLTKKLASVGRLRLYSRTLKGVGILSLTFAEIAISSFPGSTWERNFRGSTSDFYQIASDQNQSQENQSQGKPRKVTRGGSRGDCLATPKRLIPLTAYDDEPSLTISTHPTFWVYVPYKSDQAQSGEFSLQDTQENDIYRTRFTLPATPGIVKITIPDNRPALEANKTYNWYFKLSCPSENKPEPQPEVVIGQVKLIALASELQQQLKAATTPQARLDFYAKNNIWYDRLTELGDNISLTANPSREWTEILKYFGLEIIAEEPIIGSIITSSPTE
ncbi:MAG TPA: hypothetical protein DDW76_06315 [Cyanobacteria bacterium UBA11369]|nr:hypothetical protein [Cyanobacteria bacterium UBA11371]HBE18373.1 hypothetical protein [Cyanobacteria bacterium UBA11367]HBE29805.1 hypothetical protein [Cyanobacteria bacterium UBA11368]HBE48419.1 hypothetical protein [Cyanobacteria bacterium UBA11369]